MIVAGFGARGGATSASFRDALARCGGPPPSLLATPADRAPLLAPLAAELDVPLGALPPAALTGIATPTASAASLAARGTGSVAEAAALVAAGPGARIIVTRRIAGDGRATCALAETDPA